MLGSLCNQTRPLAAPAPRPVVQSGCSAFVAVDGDDSNAGTSWATAKKTVSAGIAVTRKQSAPRKLCAAALRQHVFGPVSHVILSALPPRTRGVMCSA